MCSLQVFSPSIFSPLILSQFPGLFWRSQKMAAENRSHWWACTIVRQRNLGSSWKSWSGLRGFWGEGDLGGGLLSNGKTFEDSEPRYEDMVGYLRVWELRTLGFWFFFWMSPQMPLASHKEKVVSSLDMSEPSQLRLVGWLVVCDFSQFNMKTRGGWISSTRIEFATHQNYPRAQNLTPLKKRPSQVSGGSFVFSWINASLYIYIYVPGSKLPYRGWSSTQ